MKNLIILALVLLFCGVSNAMTVRVTWNIVEAEDLEGYGFYYKIMPDGEWKHFKDTSVNNLPQKVGLTGKHFTVPDREEIYALAITSYDEVPNRSGATVQVIINTTTQDVSIEETPVLPEELPEASSRFTLWLKKVFHVGIRETKKVNADAVVFVKGI